MSIFPKKRRGVGWGHRVSKIIKVLKFGTLGGPELKILHYFSDITDEIMYTPSQDSSIQLFSILRWIPWDPKGI